MDFFLSQSFHIITKKQKIFFHSPLHQLPIESIKFHADAVRCVSVCVSVCVCRMYIVVLSV